MKKKIFMVILKVSNRSVWLVSVSGQLATFYFTSDVMNYPTSDWMRVEEWRVEGPVQEGPSATAPSE